MAKRTFMRVRDRFTRRCGPGSLGGAPLSVWLAVLRDNRFAVDWPYWPRAALITLASLPNTVTRWCEGLLYNRKIAATQVKPPLFVLGIWRSGTTHLHNLLAVDDRFAFPNFYQVTFPWSFLLTERTSARLASLFLPNQRPQDNVALGIGDPQEDEFALCALLGRSLLLSMAFPRNDAFYDRYVTLGDLSREELEEWTRAFVWFLKKLTLKYDRPLVLKSPGHTCRVRLLLELFPEATFVHIRRNPYDVFLSAVHTLHRVVPWWQLQRFAADKDFADQVLRQYREVYDSYFDERKLIPPGHLHELAFEDLERDPVAEMRRVYEALALPDFSHVAGRLCTYVDANAGYRKNVFAQLSQPLREQVYAQCRRSFDEWGYPA